MAPRAGMKLSEYILNVRKVKATILAPDNVPAEKQENFDSNADSPLMCLPPELRNRIYRLVLTGRTIHVTCPWQNKRDSGLTVKHQLIRKVCTRDSTDEDDAVTIQAANSLNVLHKHRHDFASRHKGCTRGDTNQFNLEFLQTSRQIHHEAALLFYQENTFSFDDIINLEAFLEFLVPAQVLAVQRITFVYHEFISNVAFEKRLKAKLGSLKSLVIFVDKALPRHGKFVDTASSCVSRLQRLSIESAKVAANSMDMTWMKAHEAKLEKEWEMPKKAVKPKTKAIENKLESSRKTRAERRAHDQSF